VGKRALLSMLSLSAVALILAGCSFLGGNDPEFTYWEPDLSPDGRTLVYESVSGKTLDLFARDLETGEERRLTENDVEDWSPSWSPEGDQLAFASSRDDNVDIYTLQVDTRETKRVTTHEGDDINPSWGVDGRIYFNSNRTDSWEIYVIDPDGSDLTQLTTSASAE